MADPLSAEEIARRRPLWWALSDLMLDTDVPDLWGVHIARVMREGGWTLAETRQIFHNEVGPALIANFLAVAGEWAGWEEDFVARRVLARLSRPAWLRWVNARPFRKQLRVVWEHTLPYLEQALSENAGAGPDEAALSR